AVAASAPADRRRARQISTPPITAATSATSRIQASGPRPLELAVAAAAEAAGVGPAGAAAVVGGGAAAAVVGGGATAVVGGGATAVVGGGGEGFVGTAVGVGDD